MMSSSRQKSQASLDSSSSEDDLISDICIDDKELNDIDVTSRKPHFLDYDAVPPPEFESITFTAGQAGCKSSQQISESAAKSSIVDPSAASTVKGSITTMSSGENVKMDKKYERDGEISDYELAASGFTKKDVFPLTKMSYDNERNTGARRKKHFLDENPIPPDYMVEKDPRENRSLDRNFDRRQVESESQRYGSRKHSLDRDAVRLSRKGKDPNHLLFRNIENEPSESPTHRNNWPTDRPIETASSFSNSKDNQLASNNKVECVYTLLSMLGSQDPVEMSKKLLELSRAPETCATLRQSGCIPLLVQMMHSDSDAGTRKRAASALHNIVHYQPDDKTGRREAKVLRLIEHIMEYCSFLKNILAGDSESVNDDPDRHPLAAVSSLMKVSFDEEHRHAMCQLGALQAIANIFHLDHASHGQKPQHACCNSLRRYALMALTNLTFGDGNNKALLCANREFMEALVAQLDCAPDDLLQVTGSVLRNLSWRADNNMKVVLNEIGTVTALTKAAMRNKNENTLKSILSALWNLSAHCSTNKAEFCAVDGALAFLVDMLQYEGPSKTLTIVENAGGILRNVSSRIAVREDYRIILRQRNCLGILLQQLKSESLTVVSNACGILWNLSARVPEDQKFLWDNGAVPMLRSLIHSKHKMIAEGSSAALKNLQNYRPTALNSSTVDPIARSMGLKELPTLNARKQRTLEQALNQNLAETYDNIDAVTPPKEKKDFLVTDPGKPWAGSRLTKSAIVSKSESRDSIVSAKSDSVYEKLRRGCSAPPDHGDLIDQETEYPIDYSAKYNSEVVENPIEDTVKCYETEGTPYIISNAASVSDLRNPKIEEQPSVTFSKDTRHKPEPLETAAYGSGIYTPEKPINYCEEGTPGYFSRYESLSSLDESPQNPSGFVGKKSKPEMVKEEGYIDPEKTRLSPIICEDSIVTDSIEIPIVSPAVPCAVSDAIPVAVVPAVESAPLAIPINSAQETPLMFSRRSSMDSLTSVEPNTADDKSSVVSDFSRMASGIISPSEIPDSPTQSMPQSPRRNSSVNPSPFVVASVQQNTDSQSTAQKSTSNAQQPSQPLRSVFEDDVNRFHVENTPAQFSCATSLSNLSLEDEPQIIVDVTAANNTASNMASHATEDEIENDMAEKNAPESSTSTDGEEGFADNVLLADCITMGMTRGSPSIKRPESALRQIEVKPKEKILKAYGNNEEDAIRSYCTEDTPALLSKVGSNSNLSALSINTNKTQNVNISDESSVSDGSNDLLEQCIRQGMQKSTSKERVSSSLTPAIPAKDPIAMLRCGGLPPYLPVRDEMNKFVVEDSPCAFSVLSGLSGLTVGSGVAEPAKLKRVADKAKDPGIQTEPGQKLAAEDSLSSISMESDDENILNQAIAAGANKLRRENNNSALRKVETGIQNMRIANPKDANDSLSSVDSSDSNDNQAKTLFEQCVRAGMNKQRKLERSIPKPSNLPRQSTIPLLNTTNRTPMQVECDRRREREQRDEQILKECINSGIASKCGRLEPEIRPPTRHVKPLLVPNEFTHRFVTGGGNTASALAPPLPTMNATAPKNGETTSVAVLEQQQQPEATTSYSAPNIAPGVEMRESPDGTSIESRNRKEPQRSDHQTRIENLLNITGSDQLRDSYGSLNMSDGNCLLQQSNEYPALKLSNIDYNEDSVNESSFEMEISNEFLIEKDDIDVPFKTNAQAIHDKHKDPDLMLKSVERLTHELVSTAEYLRTNASCNSEIESNEFDSNCTVYGRKSGSNSNNTWNEDTCPNDVSFPSVSITAPMIASLNEDETTMSDICLASNKHSFMDNTPTNENISFLSKRTEDCEQMIDPNDIIGLSQPDSLGTETDTLVYDEVDNNDEASAESSASGIRFQVGGEVQSQLNAGIIPQFVCSGPKSFDSCSTMSNSTIIAMEANKLADQLMQNMVDSMTSLDLDNIRPPSGMDCISLSGCPEITPQSPQLSRTRKRSLPPGLMAKRALSGGQVSSSVLGGSAESVNSICNLLDNIKPPSLMDELLDSMMSVASIQSEIVDNSLDTAQSNYETAFSDVDENTTMLQSCMDTMLATEYDDSNDGTPIPSDFSSAESTPRKTRPNNLNPPLSGVKRTLTPKQRRRLTKDRFKTYTIAAGYVLQESFVGDENDQYENELQNSDEGVHDDDEILQIEINHESTQGLEETRQQAEELVNNNVPRSIKRRSLNPERYRTRTIVYHADNDTASILDPVTFTINDGEPISTAEDPEDLSSLRAMTRQFKYITEPVCTPKKNALRRNRLTDEEAHRTESDFNSIEFDQNSETESCDQNLNRTTDDETSPKRCFAIPRIVKPTTTQLVTTDDSGVESGNVQTDQVIAVRGRKKPAYVSPYRRSAMSGGNSRNVSPKSQIGNTTIRANLSTKSSPDLKRTKVSPKGVNSKTHIVINKSDISTKTRDTGSKSKLMRPGFINNSPTANKRTVAQKNLLNKKLNSDLKAPKGTSNQAPNELQPDTSVTTLERQGTFVKDEPSTPELPVVTSPIPSPSKVSKLPTKTSSPIRSNQVTTPKSPARASPFGLKYRTPIQKSESLDKSKKLTPKGTTSLTPRTKSITSSTSDLHRRKSSLIGVKKSPSVPTVPQRSNSNASLRMTNPGTNPPSRSNSNLTTPRPVISRIAGIWKKSDDAKKSSPTNSKQTAGKPPSGAAAGTSKLIRSSTFDNTPEEKPTSNGNDVSIKVSKLTPKLSLAGKKDEVRVKALTGATSSVIRRKKALVSNSPAAADEGEPKRVSRVGTFINIEGDCQVVG